MTHAVSKNSGYSLLAAGELVKIERFGEIVLKRPSTQAIWKLPRNSDVKVDAEYHHEGGWECFRDLPESWTTEVAGVKIEIRPQTNGQVGLFPEHLRAIAALRSLFPDESLAGLKVLNLFAYTGLASLVLAKAGADICHVDNSKAVLTWAKKNCELNGVDNKVRFICDDALVFLEREVRRGSSYHIVIADPPSFSRLSKSKTWTIEEAAAPMVENISKLLSKEKSAVLLPSHHVIGAEAFLNLLYDVQGKLPQKRALVPLELSEEGTGRVIPAGSGLVACFT